VKQDNQQTAIFPPGIAAFDFDEDAHEIYITDGFLNKRILVYDMNTGAFKRGWGGHGIPLTEIDNDPTPPYDISGPPPDQKQFAPALHCAHVSTDGLVYVCERGSDRIQVFTKQGKFVTSFFVHPSTQSRGPHCGGIWSTQDPPCGTVYNLAFSRDPQQKYLLVADGTNNMVWILDRKSGTLAGSFGGNGRYAGQLHWIDAIAVDSKGNVYTGEVEDGKRIQKFIPTNSR
jgi:DNA-binding beta-propeller fold protein YncE